MSSDYRVDRKEFLQQGAAAVAAATALQPFTVRHDGGGRRADSDSSGRTTSA